MIYAGDKQMEIVYDVAASDHIIMEGNGNSKELKKEDVADMEKIVDSVESGKTRHVKFRTIQPEKLFENIKACYDHFIVAGGGLVTNRVGELLVIFRRGKWDLPKGKVDEGENVVETAVREVKEETGLKEVTVISKFANTYHTYIDGGEKVLKETCWYLMSSRSEKLFPEEKENITKAEWLSKSELSKVFENTYDNIALLLKNLKHCMNE